MAEGDEAARRQQPQQGLRRRRQTSDSSVGVNHVSSTTSLGTGRRGRGHGGRESGRLRPLGLEGTGRPVGSKTAAGWLCSVLAAAAARSLSRSLAGPSLSRAPRSAARPERAARGPRLAQLAGERAARPPARRRRVAAAVSAPTRGGGLEPGPRGRDARRSASGAGSVTRRALTALGA